ncbi:hypothetical protein WJX72_011935 [[Myrmecia] bisecta]|uniref:Uncharacterized protein n=1 Tax=[Myrmecia] bisecta TaxID=41462 RepID=A0AAW1Q1V8_9CHLO
MPELRMEQVVPKAAYDWVHSGLLSPNTCNSRLALGLCAVGLVLLYLCQSRQTTTGRRDYLHLVGAALAITIAVEYPLFGSLDKLKQVGVLPEPATSPHIRHG